MFRETHSSRILIIDRKERKREKEKEKSLTFFLYSCDFIQNKDKRLRCDVQLEPSDYRAESLLYIASYICTSLLDTSLYLAATRYRSAPLRTLRRLSPISLRSNVTLFNIVNLFYERRARKCVAQGDIYRRIFPGGERIFPPVPLSLTHRAIS